jgi:Uma2 family endonuclease
VDKLVPRDTNDNDGGMTVTESPPHRGPFTVADLDNLPDDGNRYEIFDGSLVVSPAPKVSHSDSTDRLGNVLRQQAPPDLRVLVVPVGVDLRGRNSYFIPDLVVVPEAVMRTAAANLDPSDVLLVAEVLSPSNRGTDLVLKRHDYAAVGIPRYWLVDLVERTLTVLVLDEGATSYREEAVLKPGEGWSTDQPYPIELDPAEVF